MLVRTVDLAPQGISGEISGLAFNAAGQLLASSTRGFVDVLDLTPPVAPSAPHLTSIAALGVAPALWAPSIAIGSIASLVLLIVFFDPWLVVGIGIDVVLLWATVVGSVPSSSRLA